MEDLFITFIRKSILFIIFSISFLFSIIKCYCNKTKGLGLTILVNKIVGTTMITNKNVVFHTQNMLTLNIFYL
jgi:hypothetical protein